MSVAQELEEFPQNTAFVLKELQLHQYCLALWLAKTLLSMTQAVGIFSQQLQEMKNEVCPLPVLLPLAEFCRLIIVPE